MDFNHDLYKTFLDHLLEGVYATDRDRRIIYWNQAAERLTGYKASEVIGKCCRDLILMHVDEEGENLCDGSKCPAEKSMCQQKSLEKDIYLKHKDGHRVPIHTRVSPIKDTEGKVIGAIELFDDNTAAITVRQRIEELEKLALIDPLTELGNRRFGEITLQTKMDQLERYGWSFGVIFMDIDHFKEFNDQYDHETGDRVLRMAAKTIFHSIRSIDMVCRWGGEEFVAFITNIPDEKELYTIAEKCRVLVEKSSLQIHNEILKVTISVGAALSKPDDTINTLLKRADELMYQSKLNGRNRVTLEMGCLTNL